MNSRLQAIVLIKKSCNLIGKNQLLLLTRRRFFILQLNVLVSFELTHIIVLNIFNHLGARLAFTYPGITRANFWMDHVRVRSLGTAGQLTLFYISLYLCHS
jgi:hypothetical protein